MNERRRKGRRWRPQAPANDPVQSGRDTADPARKDPSDWLKSLSRMLTILLSTTRVLAYFGIRGCNAITIKIMVKDIETQEAIPYAKITSSLSLGDTLTATSGGGIDLSINGRVDEKILISAWADKYQKREEYYAIQSAIPIDLKPERNNK